MWTIFFGVLLCAVLLILLSAAFVALFLRDPRRRHDGYRVLALSITCVTCVAGLLAVGLRIHG